jgi:DNA-binding transcriptional MerR regulator
MDSIDISEVARRTGLSARALRFYEARGLVKPARGSNGRRYYGAGELARLNAVVALKRAGFTLSVIDQMLKGRQTNLARLVAAQITEIDARAADLSETRVLLAAVKSRIDRGEQIDVATLCSLIQKGNKIMEHENWQGVADRYLSETAKADFAAAPPAGADYASYAAPWSALTDRIEAALPLDPASPEARAFYDAWQALLAPFTAVATPAMMQGVSNMYDHIDAWKGDQQPPFSSAVWDFIKQVGAQVKSTPAS